MELATRKVMSLTQTCLHISRAQVLSCSFSSLGGVTPSGRWQGLTREVEEESILSDEINNSPPALRLVLKAT